MLAAPVSGNPKVAESGRLDDRRLWPRRRLGASPALPRGAGPAGHLRRRGRTRAAGEDLPQPHARRRRPVHGRDHGAGREGRGRRAPTSSSSSTTASWARRSPATSRRPTSTSISRRPSPPSCCSRTSISASRPRASSTWRCRWRPRPSRSSRPSGPRQRGRLRGAARAVARRRPASTLEPENVEVDDGLGPPASAGGGDGDADGDGAEPRRRPPRAHREHILTQEGPRAPTARTS